MEKQFPNGFTSWQETHYEVVSAIERSWNAMGESDSQVVSERQLAQGHGGLYELAEELTDEFEALNAGREWDGEFFDEIEVFLDRKLKVNQPS